MKDKKKSQNQIYYMPMCMCWGTALGVIIGIFTNNLSICLAIGASLGLSIGSLIDALKSKKAKDAYKDEEAE